MLVILAVDLHHTEASSLGVDQEIRSCSCSCEDRLQIIEMGQCVLNHWFVESQIRVTLTNYPPILAVLPGNIRLPANDQQRMAD